MRVALVAEWLSSYAGSEVLAITSSILTQEGGVYTKVICMHPEIDSEFSEILNNFNLDYESCPPEFANSLPKKIGWLQTVVRQGGIECVHFIPVEKTAIEWLSEDRGIPVVVTETTNAGRDVWWIKKEEYRNVLRAHKVITMSDVAAHNLKTIYGVNRTVIIPPTVVDFNSFEFAPVGLRKSSPHSICYIGRFSEEKGVEFLLAAMALILRTRSDVILTLYGEGEDEIRLSNITEMFGISHNVIFAGSFSPRVRHEIYSKTELVVLPSLTEGLPTCLLEAMANQRTFVASRVGGVESLLPNSSNWASLVEPGDVNGLANSILGHLKDGELLKENSRKARLSFEEKWHPYNIQKTLIKCYREVMT